jgi:hypothetical protein
MSTGAAGVAFDHLLGGFLERRHLNPSLLLVVLRGAGGPIEAMRPLLHLRMRAAHSGGVLLVVAASLRW